MATAIRLPKTLPFIRQICRNSRLHVVFMFRILVHSTLTESELQLICQFISSGTRYTVHKIKYYHEA